MTSDLDSLEALLHEEIPLSRAMGVTVSAYDGHVLRLRAPLAPNINHKRTAFGGSLYTLAVLSGWALLQLKLREAGLSAQVVIQQGEIEYLRPVEADFEAVCGPPPKEDVARFLLALQRRGMARLNLLAEIRGGGETAVTFTGRYVALRIA